MSPPDLKTIPGIKLDGNEPVFNEPWEAQAFALVVRLYEQGMFDWSEWTQALGAAIAQDDGSSAYYQIWYNALEDMVSKNGLVTDVEINTRRQEWQSALSATPHGQPVELENGKHL